ncbi:MAG: HDOD domain-containing protein [Methylococcaceae bacterium]|nr:HDOD domain-containing protein [Methylococcaceae bacterium]
MNWFKKLFSKIFGSKPTQDQNNNEFVKEKITPSKKPTSCSKPIKTSTKRLTADVLKKFIPLKNMDEKDLDSLAIKTQIFSKKSILFIQGDKSKEVYYLLSGTVQIQPDSNNSYNIAFDTPVAHLPLNSGKTIGGTATALTEVTLLVVPGELNQLWAIKSDNEEDSYVELNDFELPAELSNHAFFESFSQAYRENKLRLPSLPNVALKLNKAMANEDIGVNEAVDIIHMDSAIVTKLIQVSNSPAYAPVNPITNCHDAVLRLGLEATRNLVMGISLKQLFKCEDKQLMQSMESLWKKSLYLSSLSFVLASETNVINPDDALLAGLVADIGTIPLLHFAEENPSEHPDFKDIESAMPYLRAPVGSLVLHTLGFSKELSAIPHHSEDWFYDKGDKLTLTDIVILAKLHSYISTKKTEGLPYINSIPAYSKLKKGSLDANFSLMILQKTQSRVNSTMQMLS